MMRKKGLGIFILLIIPLITLATIDNDLGNFFNGLGYISNVTRPQAYNGQGAGYYTGGSLFLRNRIRNVQIATVELPSYRAGCGGIDLFTGGLSYINSQELINSLKNVANNASSYAFMLALKTVSPLIENTMSGLQSWANRVNAMNINSCETGAALVGGLWPKTDVAQQEVCQSVGMSDNVFSDWAAARQGCGSAGQRSSILEKGKDNDRYKDMILENTNIAWHAIRKNAFLSKDTELAELFMSLSGTIIVIHKEGSNQFPILPSLADDRSLMRALLEGGTTTIYKCDEDKRCLNPTIKEIKISDTKALGAQVKSLLTDMIDHIYNDTALTEQEKGLLASTSLPIYKMLNVESAYYGDPNILNITQYSELIASSIIYQYIHESLQVVEASSSVLQYPDDVLSKFQAGIQNARRAISTERRQTFEKINQTLTLIENTRTLERQLAGYLTSDLQDNLSWAKGLR